MFFRFVNGIIRVSGVYDLEETMYLLVNCYRISSEISAKICYQKFFEYYEQGDIITAMMCCGNQLRNEDFFLELAELYKDKNGTDIDLSYYNGIYWSYLDYDDFGNSVMAYQGTSSLNEVIVPNVGIDYVFEYNGQEVHTSEVEYGEDGRYIKYTLDADLDIMGEIEIYGNREKKTIMNWGLLGTIK